MSNIELAKRTADFERFSSYPSIGEEPIPCIPHLADETKTVLNLDLNGHPVSLFTREVVSWCTPTLVGFDSNLTPAEIYLTAIQILKERGFPVVDTVRQMSEMKVATTNLAADGSSIYDTKIDLREFRDTQDMDDAFWRIPIGTLQRAAQELVKHANKNGVRLPHDGPFHTIVHPDGGWQLVVLDIGKITIYNRSKDLPKDDKKDNEFYTDKALRDLSKIQNNILSLRTAWGLV